MCAEFVILERRLIKAVREPIELEMGGAKETEVRLPTLCRPRLASLAAVKM